MSKRSVSIDWRELTWLIESNLKGVAGFGGQPRVEGKLSFIAEGIGHDNYFFRVGDEAYVLRLPKRFGPIRSKADAIVLLQREIGDSAAIGILPSAPQKEPNGLQRRLDAYAQAGGAVIDKNAVRIHEMLMIMGWLAGAMDEKTRREGSGHGPEYYEAQLSAVLKRSHSDS